MHALLSQVEIEPGLLATPWGLGLLLGGLFVLGSLLGSFANVVVYRLPRREPALARLALPSLPASDSPTRQRADPGLAAVGRPLPRLPAAISVRYPLVEALFALLAASLGWHDLVATAAPLADPLAAAPGQPAAAAWLLLVEHWLVLGTLCCAALIELDSQPVPYRLWLPGLLFGTAAAIALGWLGPMPTAWYGGIDVQDQRLRAALSSSLVGAAAGLWLGGLAWPATRTAARPTLPRGSLAAGLVLCGALLGWPVACCTALGGMGLALVAAAVGRVWQPAARVGVLAWLALAAWLVIVCPVNLPGRLAAVGSGPWPLLAGGGLVAALAAWRPGFLPVRPALCGSVDRQQKTAPEVRLRRGGCEPRTANSTAAVPTRARAPAGWAPVPVRPPRDHSDPRVRPGLRPWAP